MKDIRKEMTPRVALSYINTGDRFKSCVFSVNFILPVSREKTHLYSMVPSILNSGTVKYRSRSALTVRFQELYGALVATRIVKKGTTQLISIEADMLSDKYCTAGNCEAVVDMLAELLFNPLLKKGAFRPDFTELEKNAVIDKIRAEKNNKAAYSVYRCSELMLGDEEIGIRLDGDEDAVSKITPRDLFEAYKEMLTKSRVEICYVGDADMKAAELLARKIADRLPDGVAAATEKNKSVIPQKVREFTEKMNMEQGRLAIGFRCVGDMFENEAARNMFIHILSASPMSRLFVNIREKHSICYYCRAKTESDSGIMIIYSGLENSKFKFAKDAIVQEIADVADGNISDEEFEAAKKSLFSAIDYMKDSPADIERWQMDRVMMNRSPDTDALRSAIENMSKKDISECAKCVYTDTVLYIKGNSNLQNGDIDE